MLLPPTCLCPDSDASLLFIPFFVLCSLRKIKLEMVPKQQLTGLVL